MILDLTLNALQIPNLPTFTPSFGTKKTGLNEGLSTAEVNTNMLMPWTRQRPFIVSENSSTGVIEANSVIQCQTGCTALTLGAGDAAGIEVRVINTSLLTIAVAGSIVEAGKTKTFTWDGSAWISMIAGPHKKIITTIGTTNWICPNDVNKILLTLLAAGGNGSSSATTTSGAGGGSGEWLRGHEVTVVPGTTYSIVLSSTVACTAFGITFNKGGNASGVTAGAAGLGSATANDGFAGGVGGASIGGGSGAGQLSAGVQNATGGNGAQINFGGKGIFSDGGIGTANAPVSASAIGQAGCYGTGGGGAGGGTTSLSGGTGGGPYCELNW